VSPSGSPLRLVRGGPDALDPAQVGHKFARLERMRRAGMRVPALFSLPASVFDDALAMACEGLALPDDPAAHAAARAEALRRLVLLPAWRDALLAAFDAEFGAAARVAVRACVVPAGSPGGAAAEVGEDSDQDPFAGMSDSYLYVTRDRLADRVAACWASAFTGRAVQYRLWRGLDPNRARVAVGVQRMAEGTRSFVAFTRDPRSGSPCVVIAAALGIGEGVVQEKADVDHFYVSQGRVRADLVHKERMVVRRSEHDGSGDLAVVPVPRELAQAPVLSDALALEIARMAQQVEAFFEGPQDIEGTVTADGAVHLVQARPMVAAGPAPAATLYWCNYNITESYPGVSGALTFSLSQEFYRRTFGDVYRRMGVPKRRFDAHRHHLEQMVAFLEGRIYYRLDAWHALHGQMPVFELVRPLWEEAMGVTGAARDTPRWSTARALLALPGTLIRRWGHARQVRDFLSWWDGLMRQAGDLSGRTPEQLIGFYRHLWAQVSVQWGVTLTNSLYALLELRVLRHLLARWTGAGGSLLAGLLVGGRPNRSLQAARAAIALAERFAAHAELKAALLDRSVPLTQLWQDLCAQRHGAGPLQAMRDYLQRFGDRALHDLKLEEPTPRQRPWMLLDSLRSYVEQGLTLARLDADETRAVQQAQDELARRCPGPARRKLLQALAARVRSYITMREDMRFCRTQLYGLSRQVLWTLGEALARSGRLDQATDVQDLCVAEVLGAFDGTLAGSDLRGLARLRRREREAHGAGAPAGTLLATEANLPLAQALARARPVLAGDGGEALNGLGSSAGIVRAPAKLVLEPSVSADACRGSILVARETDPGWLFLMMAAKGLVVERGTLLSHTAITGRLLGIPTVVSVPNATRLIPDGATIEIDGSAGTVRIVQAAAPATEGATS